MANTEGGIFQGWHVKKEVQLTHIAATMGAIIAVVVGWVQLETEQTRQASDIRALSSRVSIAEAQVNASRETLARIEERTVAIQAQLERLDRRLEDADR